MSKPFNVAVIGYGMAAKVFHIPVLTAVPSLRLHAIVQRNPTDSDNAEKDHPGVKGYRSTEEMVKDPDVDVVVITTIPDTHVALAKLVLNAKKHVLVEKPFTPTSAEAEELIQLAKKQGCLITVYQNRRWDSDFLTASQLIKKGTLGRVAEFETHFDRFRPEVPTGGSWKNKILPASGAAYDLGTHLIDQVTQLFGLPQKVTGFVGAQRQGETYGYEDSCTVLLHYDNGLLATVKASVISPEKNQLRYWIRGEKGSYKKHHLDCQEDQLKAGMKPSDSGFAIEPKENHGVLTTVAGNDFKTEVYPTVKPDTYVEFYKIFASALSGKGDVPVKAEQARDVIRLIELARQSSKEGRTLNV
ncbi:MAG: hypothetical protein M4579_000282 [Chaenotheca gracillima]|nr:MAG: hypothetical protein M4579_000282 [Chaenotheca gracillima]